MGGSSSAGLAQTSAQRALENITRRNSATNAILEHYPEEVLREAERLDLQFARGIWPGALYGLTVCVKDNIDVAGRQTRAGGLWLTDRLPKEDATVVMRLRRQGALIIGKANLHEGAFGPTSQNPHYGDCHNPWDLSRIAGGSSGGSGVAVAAEMSDVALGTDTAGSVRIPASYNGISGLRPTMGAISNFGTVAVSPNFDTVGPMARRVADVERLFRSLVGYDDRDPASVPWGGAHLLSDLSANLNGLKLGIMGRYFLDQLDPNFAALMDETIHTLRKLGADVVDVDLGSVETAKEKLAFTIMVADALAEHRERLDEYSERYGADLIQRFEMGRRVSGADYADALRWMQTWRHRLRRVFRDVDAIVSPTTPTAAPRLADVADLSSQARRDITKFTSCWALAGVPSLVFPCGLSDQGLPLSVQLTGDSFSEPALFRIGKAFQNVTMHHEARPPDFEMH